MGVPGVASKAAEAALKSSPLGGAYSAAKGLLGSLGIGKGADDKKYADRLARSRAAVLAADSGDADAVAYLGAVGRVAPLPRSIGPASYTDNATLPKGWTSKDWGKAYSKIIDRAAAQYRQRAFTVVSTVANTGGVPSQPSPTSAPVASGRSKRTTSTGSTNPVATSAPRPCKYGPRGPDGRCPRKSEAIAAGFIPAPAAKPCKYGPRGPDGRCPKKPPTTSRNPRTLGYWIGKAASIGGTVAAAGARGAATALKGLVNSGQITWGEIAAYGVEATGLILAAAATGWFAGQDIARSLSGENAQLRIQKLNQDRLTARHQLEKALGRAPTLQEQSSITAEYEKRLWMIQTNSVRPPTAAELAQAKADGTLYRTSNTPG